MVIGGIKEVKNGKKGIDEKRVVKSSTAEVKNSKNDKRKVLGNINIDSDVGIES